MPREEGIVSIQLKSVDPATPLTCQASLSRFDGHKMPTSRVDSHMEGLHRLLTFLNCFTRQPLFYNYFERF
jgi:hypothetical protein